MHIFLAQTNPIVGAIRENLRVILETIAEAKAAACAMAVFPELAITGYPPEDLLFRPALQTTVDKALTKIAMASKDIAVVVGHPYWQDGQLFNSASVFYQGECLTRYHKHQLPNEGVFDERRYFAAGKEAAVFTHQGVSFGILICHDGWFAEPAQQAKAAGAQVLLQLNASPFFVDRVEKRIQAGRARCLETGLPLLSTYLSGGQDELVFDGGAFACNAKGQLCANSALFAERSLTVSLVGQDVQRTLPLHTTPPAIEQMYQALVLAVKDYLGKSGFTGAILGLSGGIDSALTLAIAVDALGAENVEAVLMPSQYTADISIDDALSEARALGVKAWTLPIQPGVQAFEQMLAEPFQGCDADLTEENIQARLRGVLLMALSNKTGKLVLTTSNKSEVAVGYSTLYGDMAGGFNVLKDVYKTQVYALARYRNTRSYVIPERVLTRAPSAELRPDQTDQDSLPPYDILDDVLRWHVEHNLDAEEIADKGFDLTMTQEVLALVKRNEYKRNQAPLGPKITARSFGKDWRLPVVNRYGD